MIRVLGLALYGPLAASNRVRLGQYVDGLAAAGIDLKVQSLLDNRYVQKRFQGHKLPLGDMLGMGIDRLRVLLNHGHFDAAILHCELFPLMPGWLERSLLPLPYIYDFDDAFYLRYQSGRMASLKPMLGGKFDSVMAGAAAVTAGNSYLAEYAQKFNSNVAILPSVVDTMQYCPKKKSANEVFTIGWIGSPSTAVYLSDLVAPLSQLGAQFPLRFVVVGGKAPVIENVQVDELPWEEHTEIELINSFDVGVMPLPDDEWARGKCAFKLIQYMACGIPVVGSRVGTNIEVVTKECGFLVEGDIEWAEAINVLRSQAPLRDAMGIASRQRAEKHYSLARNLPLLVETVHAITGNS